MEFAPINLKIKKTVSNGKVYEMVELEEYHKNPKAYLGRHDVGIVVKQNGEDIVIPLRENYTNNPISPGVYNAGCIDFIVEPDESSHSKYVPEQIVSFDSNMDAQKIIESGEQLRRLDEPFITTPDNITKIPISVDDQPEMKVLKMALNEKNMDFDKYANRFGQNFPNDKRQLKNNSVTLNIIKRFCANMDMEAILTLRDKSPDVPNPIGHDITMSLTDEYTEEDND